MPINQLDKMVLERGVGWVPCIGYEASLFGESGQSHSHIGGLDCELRGMGIDCLPPQISPLVRHHPCSTQHCRKCDIFI